MELCQEKTNHLIKVFGAFLSCPIDGDVNPSCHLSILDGGSDSKTLENIQKMPLERIKAISQLCDQCLRRSQS